MIYFSTRDPQYTLPVSFEDAVLSGLAQDGGLYMPEHIPCLPDTFFQRLHRMELPELAFEVISAMIGDDIPNEELRSIVAHTFNFPISVVPLSPHSAKTETGSFMHVIELFNGQTMAFKDVGARFMARTMSYFNASKEGDLHVIVATSGDTGGAVAAGFYQVPGVQVHILFPKGKVSRLQELQLTTWGENIHAYRVDGTFDDCQALSKQALSDPDIRNTMRITSANSINISRLIPQMVYYFWGASQWLSMNGMSLTGGASDPISHEHLRTSEGKAAEIQFTYSIPSGNFGNLTAGLFAKRMGLPVSRLIASTNDNSVLPEYLSTGEYQPRRSVKTLSNAMDVGNPSNYERMVTLFDGNLDQFRQMLSGYSFTDEEVVEEIRRTYHQYGYHLDPHTAVATLGMQAYTQSSNSSQSDPSAYTDSEHEALLILGTAHPIKFSEEADALTGIQAEVPTQAAAFFGKLSQAEECSTSYNEVKHRIRSKA